MKPSSKIVVVWSYPLDGANIRHDRSERKRKPYFRPFSLIFAQFVKSPCFPVKPS